MLDHSPNYSRREVRAIRAAVFLGMLGFISLNMYLPSVPEIARDFQIEIADLKTSIVVFLIGFSLSQFYWGSLSTKYGRKRTMLYGLLISSIGTIWVIFAHSLLIFNCARLVEGFGIGCASVLYRAMLADSLPQDKLSRVLFIIISIANIMPALAPLIGGYLDFFFGWRAIFILLLVYSFMLSIMIHRNTAETNTQIRKDLTFSHAILEYVQVFKSRKFIGYVMPYLLLSGGGIGYYSVTPFIFITHLHIAPHYYSYLLLFTVTMYVIGAGSSGIIKHRIGVNRAILLGTFSSFAAALTLLILAYFSQLSVLTVTLPMMLYVFGCGIVAPIANTCALTELRHIAGSSSAVIGSSVYAASALCSVYIANLNLSGLLSLAIYTLSLSFFAIISFYYLIIRLK